MPNGVIAHNPAGVFDIGRLTAEAQGWPGLEGMDLAIEVSSAQRYEWDETRWDWQQGYGRQQTPRYHVVAVDYGLKRNILRCLAATGCRVTIVPATTAAEDILAMDPDGVFLSNGPAIRRQPGSMRCPRSSSSSNRASRCSGSASATRCWPSRSAARR